LYFSSGLHYDEGIFNEFPTIPVKYRYIQCLSTLLNESFRIYLSWAPMIFMGHVGLLLFASFRYWNEDFISYIMFPACGVRCMLDAVTPLALAGDLCNECRRAMERWSKSVSTFFKRKLPTAAPMTPKWMFMFQSSCREINCRAGSLYKMERAILPVNLNNMALLTLNLLIAYPK